MNVQTIRKERPFIVRTSYGEKYCVPHPEFVWVGRYNVVIEDEQGGTDVIDPLHVVEISRVASAKGKNEK